MSDENQVFQVTGDDLSALLGASGGSASFRARDESGNVFTLDLAPTDVHVDAALPNYAAGYKLADGIADEVCPIVMVDKQSNKYRTWSKDDAFEEAETLVAVQGGNVNEVSPRLDSAATYICTPYALASRVTTELLANADAPLAPEKAAVRRIKNALHIGREKRAAALLTTVSNWSGGYELDLSGDATLKWNGGSNSNPIRDIYKLVEGSLTPVTHVAMSEQCYHDFITNANVQKYIFAKTGIQPIPGVNDWSALLDLPKIVVGKMKLKSRTAGTYGNYVWGNNVVGLCIQPGTPVDGETISTAKTFRWTGANAGVPDGAVQEGYFVRKYFDPRLGTRGSWVVVIAVNDAEKMTSVYAGGIIYQARQ